MRLQRIIAVPVIGLLFLFFSGGLAMGQGQQPPTQQAPAPAGNRALPTVNQLFSDWVKLSLSGFSQSEIEFRIAYIDPQGIVMKQVKDLMRKNVIENLKRMNIRSAIANSTTRHDLRAALNKIRMEVRFAGMENDYLLRLLIRDNFGISITRI
ncbi:MAG: hypothetical protein HQM13_08860 [SAR324 cluster bacterium]|nr:hypothetical protein [SAR324 cluster bacterium]